MTPPPNRTIITICGPSGAGKSHLAKALVEHLGPTNSVRIPTDYYLAPADPATPTSLQQPLRYDWALLTETLSLPEGTLTTTPDFDFDTFQRRANTGGRPITMRRITILDAIYPYPHADIRILLTTPTPERHARILARDTTWGTRIADRWHHLEAASTHLESLPLTYDLILPGTAPPAHNTAAIATLLRERKSLSLIMSPPLISATSAVNLSSFLASLASWRFIRLFVPFRPPPYSLRRPHHPA